jgi:hypothetical protein
VTSTNVAHARRGDPDTSQDAAAGVFDVSEVQAHIWFIVEQYGPVTDEEIAWHYGHMAAMFDWVIPSPQSLRSRRCELVKLGRVEFGGMYGLTPAGRRTQKWVAA